MSSRTRNVPQRNVPKRTREAEALDALCEAAQAVIDSYMNGDLSDEIIARLQSVSDNARLKKCPYPLCQNMIPREDTGGVGVSLSRKDNKTYICSACGMRETMMEGYMDQLVL